MSAQREGNCASFYQAAAPVFLVPAELEEPAGAVGVVSAADHSAPAPFAAITADNAGHPAVAV